MNHILPDLQMSADKCKQKAAANSSSDDTYSLENVNLNKLVNFKWWIKSSTELHIQLHSISTFH